MTPLYSFEKLFKNRVIFRVIREIKVVQIFDELHTS